MFIYLQMKALRSLHAALQLLIQVLSLYMDFN